MKKLFAVLAVLFMLPLLQACGFEQVDTGHRGVKVTWGEVDLKAGSLPEGFYTYNPIGSDILEMDVRTKVYKAETNTYTKDVQQADIVYAINYSLKPDQAHIMYRDVGRSWEQTIMIPAVEGAFKQVIGQWDAVDLVSNRGKATQAVLSYVKAALNDRGIIVTSLEMVNIQYRKDFEQAVENKVTATQNALAEVNRTKQVQERAKQQVIEAQAQAESMRIRANALANNPKLVEYEAVQKWDGKMPQYMLGNTTPFINVK